MLYLFKTTILEYLYPNIKKNTYLHDKMKDCYGIFTFHA